MIKFEKMSRAAHQRWAPDGAMRQKVLKRQITQRSAAYMKRLAHALTNIYYRYEATHCARRQIAHRTGSLRAWNARGVFKRRQRWLENAYRRAMRRQAKQQAKELSRLVGAAEAVVKACHGQVTRALARRLRKRFEKVIKGQSPGKTHKLIGCSLLELKTHLEKQFKPGMTWENRGFYGWHIDHIHPLCLFDLTDSVQVQQAFHFSNLQPLWAKENMRKHTSFSVLRK